MATNCALSEGKDQFVWLRRGQSAWKCCLPRVDVQRNTDGDTPSICVAAHADRKMCRGHVALYDLLGSCAIY